MPEEEKVMRAILALNKAKQNLVDEDDQGPFYIGICTALIITRYAWEDIDGVLDKVINKIHDDLHKMHGGSGYMFPFTFNGYQARIAYIDNLIKNIEDYV
jgi:hypothetical protein